MEDVIINKVAQSGIITLNLEDFYPEEEMVIFDLKKYLFMDLILKEKDYREALKNTDWSVYKNKSVAITCTADAIIPVWAYMLAVSYMEPSAKNIVFGDEENLLNILFLKNIEAIDTRQFEGKRIVVKGCGDKKIPESVYIKITGMLRPVAQSIMYGEPCSTVPVFKKK
jgi:hypothetical protein